MNANFRNFALWVIIGLVLIALFNLFQNTGQRTAGSRHRLFAVHQRGRPGPRAQRRHPGSADRRHLRDGTAFQTYAPEDPGLVQKLEDKGVTITAKAAAAKAASR